MSENTEARTYITMGFDYGQIYAAADAALDPGEVQATATRIIETYRTLVTDPATQPETPGCVPLRLVRAALADPREYVDAALRFLDSEDREDAGFPFVEITFLDAPTPADMAAAAFLPLPDGSDEAYMVTVIALADED